jgi:hypothetical protein
MMAGNGTIFSICGNITDNDGKQKKNFEKKSVT